MKILYTLLFVHAALFVFAQKEVTEFGTFTPVEMNVKQCDFDKDAEALIFFDKATSYYDDNYSLITEHRIRFKILKERGIERGNVHIRYYSNDHFEFIKDIDAVVMSYDEKKQPVKSNLDHKSIYYKKLNNYYSEASFALPNIKVGSIIEYRYVSVMKSYGGLREWVFQTDLPVVVSSYHLTILPNTEFAYSVYKNDFLPITVIPNSKDGSVLFEMNNIPGLREEAYMGAANDYLQRVKFQFAGIKHVSGDGYGTTSSTQKYLSTWRELARELMEERSFGALITKSLPNADDVALLWNTIADPYTKMKAIHHYVTSHFSWNHVYALHAEDGLKDAWEKKTGTSGEINLILINLLKDAGLDVNPLLVNERDFGKVDSTYPYIDQFNKVAAYVTIGDRHYILDGTDAGTPSFIIPFKLLNTTGFVVNKKNGALIRIGDDEKKNLNMVNVIGTIDNSGLLQLDGTVNEYDYKKIEMKEAYYKDKGNYEKSFFEAYPAIKIDSFAITGLEADSLPLRHAIKLNVALDKTGDYLLLHYNWFTGLNKNPFITEQRFSDINFGCRYSCVLNGTFNLPENLSPEALPKSLKLVTPDKSMTIIRQVQQMENMIQVGIKIDFNETEYPAKDYEQVQGFYKQMLELLNEPIVLKAKS